MAVRNDFAAGEVLAAADLNDTFASKVDYALPVNAQTGTAYTFVAADAEKLTTASNGSAVTLTVPPQSSVAWSDNTVLRVVNYGAGAVTIDGGSGVTVTNTSSTIAQYGAAVAIRTGSDAWTVVPFGGGDIPAAEVSSPAATGQYTDSGITYDYYTFTASGTLTVDTAGFADVLVVSGGGGGGGGQLNSGAGGGGGSGSYVETQMYLPSGSVSVQVGAGGSGSSYNGTSGAGSISYLNNVAAGIGGGRGATFGGGGSTTGGGGGGASDSGGASGAGFAGLAGATYGGGGSGSAASGSNGGSGTASSITGSAVTRAAGGNGNVQGTSAGSANTGNGGEGGAGSGGSYSGAAGGSGIVIIRVAV